jgi:hypothetical protein
VAVLAFALSWNRGAVVGRGKVAERCADPDKMKCSAVHVFRVDLCGENDPVENRLGFLNFGQEQLRMLLGFVSGYRDDGKHD